MERDKEIELLEGMLATMRDRIARGDARARVVAGVIEAMLAEREQEIAEELDAASGAAPHRQDDGARYR